MRFLYYGVKNLSTNKVENCGTDSRLHNAEKAAEKRLAELKAEYPTVDFKVVKFLGKI